MKLYLILALTLLLSNFTHFTLAQSLNVTIINSTAPLCGGSCDGTATIEIIGGVSPYDIDWDGTGNDETSYNSITQVATNFCGGSFAPITYNVTVTDDNGATGTTSVTFWDPPYLYLSLSNSTDVSCFGNCDGSLTVFGGGGTGNYAYSWSNGVTTGANSNLCGTSYTATVTDDNGCISSEIYTVSEPIQIIPTISASSNPLCGNSNGDITIAATGGQASLTYSIDNGVTYQASDYFSGLPAATYDIVVEDANGCQGTTQVTLADAAPSITNISTMDPSCGNNNGDLTITVSGGQAPLIYSIDNGVTFQASNYFSGLPIATYDIVVEDGNGCQETTQTTLTGSTLPDVFITATTNLLTANNVNSGVTYQWLDCNNNYAILPGETGQSYGITVAGEYAVEVTENSCVDTSVCNNTVFVGIEENSFGNDLIVYPNPTNGNFSIDLGKSYDNITIRITDIDGKLIQFNTYSEEQILKLKIEQPAGIYLLVILSEGPVNGEVSKKAVIRLVKE